MTPENGFTVLISRAENQIDYHTRNSSAFLRSRKPGVLPTAAKATNLCESVKSFPGPRITNLSDARFYTFAMSLDRKADGWASGQKRQDIVLNNQEVGKSSRLRRKNVRLGIKLNGKNIHLTFRSLSTKVEIVAGGIILGTER